MFVRRVHNPNNLAFDQIDEFVFDLNARSGYYQPTKNFLELLIFYLQGIPIAISMVLYVLIVIKIIVMVNNYLVAIKRQYLENSNQWRTQ
jgi:hypothetical protein